VILARCDVEGCEKMAAIAEIAARSPWVAPRGWSILIVTAPIEEPPPRIGPRLGGVLRPRLRSIHRKLLVCPDHPLPAFRPDDDDLFIDDEEVLE
jgi:hypothetical protein